MSALRVEIATLSATIDQEGALELPVPSCPGWKVSDLIRQVCGVYRWVAAHVVRGETTRPTDAISDYTDRETALVSWWNETAESFLSTMEGVDSDLPAWNWAPQPKRAAFWHRRIAHETTVRRWDAQMATGLAEPIDRRLAADGIAEVLDTHLAASGGTTESAISGLITLEATDSNLIWYVRLRPGGVALLDTDTPPEGAGHGSQVITSGSASDLMLALHGRIPFDLLHTSGNTQLLPRLRVAKDSTD